MRRLPVCLSRITSGEVFFYFIGTPHEDTTHYKTIQGNPSKKTHNLWLRVFFLIIAYALQYWAQFIRIGHRSPSEPL